LERFFFNGDLQVVAIIFCLPEESAAFATPFPLVEFRADIFRSAALRVEVLALRTNRVVFSFQAYFIFP
jgi:hypothetical protein